MNTPLAEMFRDSKWATRSLLEACRILRDEQLDAAPAGVSGSVRVRLMHTVGGDQTCALRTQGRQHEGELTRDSPWPGFDGLIALATRAGDDLIDIAGALESEADVDLPYVGKAFHFPRSFFLVRAIEHGVEHRTEIKVALNQLGVTTPNLDGWPWSVAAGNGQEV